MTIQLSAICIPTGYWIGKYDECTAVLTWLLFLLLISRDAADGVLVPQGLGAISTDNHMLVKKGYIILST